MKYRGKRGEILPQYSSRTASPMFKFQQNSIALKYFSAEQHRPCIYISAEQHRSGSGDPWEWRSLGVVTSNRNRPSILFINTASISARKVIVDEISMYREVNTRTNELPNK